MFDKGSKKESGKDDDNEREKGKRNSYILDF